MGAGGAESSAPVPSSGAVGVGAVPAVVPPPVSSPESSPLSLSGAEVPPEEGDSPVEGEEDEDEGGDGEGVPGSSSEEPGEVPDEEPPPETASVTVVPRSPLKLSPDTSSYVVIPAIATPKTSAAATTGRLRRPLRARWTVPSVNSPGAGGVRTLGFAATLGSRTGTSRPGTSRPCTSRTCVSRNCSPVRLKKCWKSDPPQVATTLTRPAPRIVP